MKMFLFILILVGSGVGLLATLRDGANFSFSNQSGLWLVFFVLFVTSIIYLTLKMIASGSVVQEHRLKKEKIRKEYLDSE